MVVDALVFHPTVAHYLRFAATTIGRDKLMRTVQYFARFYVWYRLRTNATTAEVAPWAALKAVLGKVVFICSCRCVAWALVCFGCPGFSGPCCPMVLKR